MVGLVIKNNFKIAKFRRFDYVMAIWIYFYSKIKVIPTQYPYIPLGTWERAVT